MFSVVPGVEIDESKAYDDSEVWNLLRIENKLVFDRILLHQALRRPDRKIPGSRLKPFLEYLLNATSLQTLATKRDLPLGMLEHYLRNVDPPLDSVKSLTGFGTTPCYAIENSHYATLEESVVAYVDGVVEEARENIHMRFTDTPKGAGIPPITGALRLFRFCSRYKITEPELDRLHRERYSDQTLFEYAQSVNTSALRAKRKK